MVSDPTIGDLAAKEKAIKARGPRGACVICKFFNRPEPNEMIYGECRRNAPISADTYGRALWPVVEIDDWCGQGAKA